MGTERCEMGTEKCEMGTLLRIDKCFFSVNELHS
jgi:hypothetical protein